MKNLCKHLHDRCRRSLSMFTFIVPSSACPPLSILSALTLHSLLTLPAVDDFPACVSLSDVCWTAPGCQDSEHQCRGQQTFAPLHEGTTQDHGSETCLLLLAPCLTVLQPKSCLLLLSECCGGFGFLFFHHIYDSCESRRTQLVAIVSAWCRTGSTGWLFFQSLLEIGWVRDFVFNW